MYMYTAIQCTKSNIPYVYIHTGHIYVIVIYTHRHTHEVQAGTYVHTRYVKLYIPTFD